MSTFKKKDLKKYKSPEKLEELVDDDGSPIGGTKGSSMNISNDSEIYVPDQQTGDEFAAQALQPNRYYREYGGVPYTRGVVAVGEGEEEIAETKMKDMIENILGDKSKNTEMVRKKSMSDVNRNEIPDISTLSNPIVTKKASDIINTINKNNLNADEVAIILNTILSDLNTNEISPDYKKILINKI